MFSGLERPSHWLVLGVIVILLFGYKKLPDAARSLGRSLRIFKTEIKGMTEDDKAREAHAVAPAPAAEASAPAAPPAPAPAAEPAPAPVTPAPAAPVEASQNGTPRAE